MNPNKPQRRLFQFARRVGIIMLGVGVAIAIWMGYTIRRSFPIEQGTLQVAGLHEQVTVHRDAWGVPHIFARNRHDLFLAQGYIHAQDRFWQMDVWRHIGSGRMAEMFGPNLVKADRFLRVMGWANIAQQELTELEPTLRQELEAYAAGVNAYLKNRQSADLALEYSILGVLNPGYHPEPWQPLHTLTWGKVMAYDLAANMEDEITRLLLRKILSHDRVEELYPPYASDMPVIVPQVTAASADTSVQPEPSMVVDSSVPFVTQLNSLQHPLESLQPLLGSIDRGLGSNNWVVAGVRTATGKPLLANDPHLNIQLPSIWYENGLHCTVSTVQAAQSSDCPYNVVGVSFPGMLGVIIGHNDRIAWGVTNVGPDVMDLFIEKINPQNPNQYEYQGHWVEMEERLEVIQVAGGEPVEQKVRRTRHGPILSDVDPRLQSFAGQSEVEIPRPYAVALQWTALEPSHLVWFVPQVNRATNWSEFRQAAQHFDVPAQNLIYGDRLGNIGYQMPGKIPRRGKGNGRYPVPGWTGQYDWQGYVDFTQLPRRWNPPEGYIVTANNAVVPPKANLWLTHDWDYGYRARRIEQLLRTVQHPLTVTDMAQIQNDAFNANAVLLVPIVQSLSFEETSYLSALQLWQNWDFQLSSHSAAAALFEVFWKHLLQETFHDQLPEPFQPNGSDRWFMVIRDLLAQSQSVWWDNINTPAIEDRDTVIRQAFQQAVVDLERQLGRNRDRWQWGKLHTATFRNGTLGKSGIGLIEGLLNRGPYPISGNSETVNSTAWNAQKNYTVTSIPSMRLIMDLADWNRTQAVHVPGQSGHPFHRHYTDLVALWQIGQFHPLLWSEAEIRQQSDRVLELVP